MTIQYVMSSNCHVYGNSVLSSTQFVSCSRSSTNCAPCVGLVITFAGPMSSVARCTIVISPLSILSFVQKYLIAMCLVFLLVLLPLSISDIHDMLSWYTVAGACGCPCPTRKFLRCNSMFAESDVAISSASVLDFATIDCLVDSTDTGPPSPMVRHAPVCDFPSSWIP